MDAHEALSKANAAVKSVDSPNRTSEALLLQLRAHGWNVWMAEPYMDSLDSIEVVQAFALPANWYVMVQTNKSSRRRRVPSNCELIEDVAKRPSDYTFGGNDGVQRKVSSSF